MILPIGHKSQNSRPLQIQDGGSPREEVDAALLWLVRNTHTNRSSHKEQEDSALL